MLIKDVTHQKRIVANCNVFVNQRKLWLGLLSVPFLKFLTERHGLVSKIRFSRSKKIYVSDTEGEFDHGQKQMHTSLT